IPRRIGHRRPCDRGNARRGCTGRAALAQLRRCSRRDRSYTSDMEYRRHGRRPGLNVAELHTHVGAAVDPAILYSIAHAQGIRLPSKNYWEFVEMVTAAPDRVKTFEEYLALFHWTELVQSSPEAMSTSVASVIAGGYRHANIDLIE